MPISFLLLNRCMENQTVNLAVSDLIMLQSIVQVACERGAFRAEEMTQIGQCYDRLSVWLTQMQPGDQSTADTQQPNQNQGE
jgi:hypothetical protein